MASLWEMNRNERILWEWLMDEEKPEDAVIDTIECNEAEMGEKLASYAHIISNGEDEVAALMAKAESMQSKVDEIKAHAKTIENKMNRMRELAGESMNLMGFEKLEANGVRMSMRAYGGGSVNITDAAAIQDKYLVPQPAKIDKKALLKAMKEAGFTELPGAEFIAPVKKFTFKF